MCGLAWQRDAAIVGDSADAETRGDQWDFFTFNWINFESKVSSMNLTSISTFLVGICSCALTAYAFFRFGKSNQKSEMRKNHALADVYFSYDAIPRIYSSNGKKIIDIDIKITNMSSNKLGILAIFVRFKPLINTSSNKDIVYSSFESIPNFETNTELEKNCSLLQMKNAAFASDFIWQTSIGGISVRRSIDIIDEKFCEKYPIVIAHISIFGSAMDYIDKTHAPVYKMDKLRMPWCNYVVERNKENYNFFGRVSSQGVNEPDLILTEGERMLKHKDGSVDVENTRMFEQILRSVITSNIEKVIDLRDPLVQVSHLAPIPASVSLAK